MGVWEYEKKDQKKCEKCGHIISLHNEDGCSFIVSVLNDGKDQKKCGCKYDDL